MKDLLATTADGVTFSLLHDPLLPYWRMFDGAVVQARLPELLEALARDDVRDYPALAHHQRGPWHDMLVKLAAAALYRTGSGVLYYDAQTWRLALQHIAAEDSHDDVCRLELPPRFLGISTHGPAHYSALPLNLLADLPARLSPTLSCGTRWRQDVLATLAHRPDILEACQLTEQGGLSLIWLEPLGGAASAAREGAQVARPIRRMRSRLRASDR